MRHLLSRLGILAVAAWLALSAIADAGATSWRDYAPDHAECGFLALVNELRVANGLRPFTLSATLGAAAEHHARDMAENNVFSHTLSDGTSWHTNVKDHRYVRGAATAENIAAGRSSARGVFVLWINSPGHLENILDPKMYAIGIGRANDDSSKYGWYWTTTFGGRSSRTTTC